MKLRRVLSCLLALLLLTACAPAVGNDTELQVEPSATVTPDAPTPTPEVTPEPTDYEESVSYPFVVEGVTLGICGALLPLGILHLIYGKVIEYLTGEFESVFHKMTFLSEHDVFVKLTPLLLGIGVLIGWFGSTSSTRKQLKKISLR